MKHQRFPDAIAHIRGSEAFPRLGGEVRLFQRSDGIILETEIYGLPESETGFFAFHIHEGSSCQGREFPDTSGHFNPDWTMHPKHAGDLPPLLSCHGKAYMKVFTDRFCVEEIIGKTVVVHSDPDDFHTQPSGNSGTKIACGRIENRNLRM